MTQRNSDSTPKRKCAIRETENAMIDAEVFELTIARCNKRLEEQLSATDDFGASSQEIEAALGPCAADAAKGSGCPDCYGVEVAHGRRR
jgi:hypothetical protein